MRTRQGDQKDLIALIQTGRVWFEHANAAKSWDLCSRVLPVSEGSVSDGASPPQPAWTHNVLQQFYSSRTHTVGESSTSCGCLRGCTNCKAGFPPQKLVIKTEPCCRGNPTCREYHFTAVWLLQTLDPLLMVWGRTQDQSEKWVWDQRSDFKRVDAWLQKQHYVPDA